MRYEASVRFGLEGLSILGRALAHRSVLKRLGDADSDRVPDEADG